jgi:hypothetical protein
VAPWTDAAVVRDARAGGGECGHDQHLDGGLTVDAPRYSQLRDLAAVVIAAVACPVAVFGGTNLGCVGQGFSSDCAMAAVAISPIMLLAAGVVAGVVTRGWTGLLMVFVGAVIGMTAILVLSFGVGDPVPIDPIAGLIATIWFSGPLAIGYGIGRVITRLVETRGAGGDGGR